MEIVSDVVSVFDPLFTSYTRPQDRVVVSPEGLHPTVAVTVMSSPRATTFSVRSSPVLILVVVPFCAAWAGSSSRGP